MRPIDRAFSYVLAQQEPFPAVVVMHGCGDLVQLCFVVTQPLLLRSVSQLQVVLAV
jgi:dienelactone hydrolase